MVLVPTPHLLTAIAKCWVSAALLSESRKTCDYMSFHATGESARMRFLLILQNLHRL
jgi:hypothetical protein